MIKITEVIGKQSNVICSIFYIVIIPLFKFPLSFKFSRMLYSIILSKIWNKIFYLSQELGSDIVVRFTLSPTHSLAFIIYVYYMFIYKNVPRDMGEGSIERKEVQSGPPFLEV